MLDLFNSSVFFQQAEKSNIRLDDVQPLASIDTVLKTQESVQDVIVQEESIGHARAEEQQSNEEADVYRRQLGDKFCAMVVRIFTNYLLTASEFFRFPVKTSLTVDKYLVMHIKSSSESKIVQNVL